MVSLVLVSVLLHLQISCLNHLHSIERRECLFRMSHGLQPPGIIPQHESFVWSLNQNFCCCTLNPSFGYELHDRVHYTFIPISHRSMMELPSVTGSQDPQHHPSALFPHQLPHSVRQRTPECALDLLSSLPDLQRSLPGATAGGCRTHRVFARSGPVPCAARLPVCCKLL